MNIGATLARGRRLAESRMREVCRIERPGPQSPDGRGGVTRPMTLVYEGKCRLQHVVGRTLMDRESVGREWVEQTLAVHIPVGAADVRPGDVVTIIEAADDPFLAGRVFRVEAPANKSQATAYRIPVVEVL